MEDITLDHTVYFRTASGEEFGREFECTLVAAWDGEHETFDLTWLEADGVVITPSWKDDASPAEAALWDRCQEDLEGDGELISRAWSLHAEAQMSAGYVA